jgi:hypothetical protein
LSKAERPLTVGDRLDTDIEGAVSAGMDSLLVLTGVSGPADLLASPAERRPAYVAADLSGLFVSADAVRVPVDGDEAGGWKLTRDGASVRLDGSGEAVDALRLLCGPAWGGAEVRAGSDEARRVFGEWKLTEGTQQ